MFQIENYTAVILLNVLRCEISSATQLLAIFVLNTAPQVAFTILYKPPNTNNDIFVEIMNLNLDDLPRPKTKHRAVCGDFKSNLLNNSFKYSWLVEFMESYDFSLKNHEPRRQGRISTSVTDLCFAILTLYWDVDQTDITDNFSVLG